MRPPTIGELRHPVRILLRADQPDGDAGVTEGYTEIARRRARIEPVGSGVYVGSVQIAATITHRITIRYFAGLTTSHVLEDGRGNRYAVRRPTNLDGLGVWTLIEAEQVGGAS